MIDVPQSSTSRIGRWLIAAVIVGALVRLPGVAWGANWPDGFTIHHPDEYTHVANADSIISPLEPGYGVPYPKAMGAYAAAPYLLWYGAHGSFGGPRVHLPWTVGAGRMISVAFGVATILIVFAIGRDAMRDQRAALFAAWLMALGGLHVTQSHFFLADVPAIGWTMLAVWLLWRDLRASAPNDLESLRWAAFAAGAAFALKLFVFVFPALAYAFLARRPRFIRIVHASVFALAGLVVSSLGFESPASLYRAATVGINVPFEFDRLRSAMIAAVQLPAILSLPLLLLALAGTWSLIGRLRAAPPSVRRDALFVFGSVPLVALAFVLFKLDPFPRHWVVFVPWAALAGGWCLARLTDGLTERGRAPLLVLAPVFLWLIAFVVDGERLFIFEPRNRALSWLRANVPVERSVNWVGRRTPAGYQPARWGFGPDPDVLVYEMHEANLALSGVNWRNSYPADHRQVFDGRSDERVAAIQSLFRGTSGTYRLAARFPESYVMPEYRMAAALLGDRSRNYISEIVIFTREGG